MDTWERITEGIPSGIFNVLKKTRTAIPIVRLGIRTGNIKSASIRPLFFNVLFNNPNVSAVPSIVEIVAEITAIKILLKIAFFAIVSLKSSTNHLHVKPLNGKLYPSLLFHAKINIISMGMNM
jgi:hypothetical protein